MLFHEIYGKYYQTVANILQEASENGGISQQEIRAAVSGSAFSESTLYIPDALRENWFLLEENGESVLKNTPSHPLTVLEKRWMKSILQDPRVRLFDPSPRGLEDVTPLFTPDMFCWYDRYEDSDPYEDPEYVRHFRLLMQAILQKRTVRLHYRGQKEMQTHNCIPYRLEYSEKDDKFRLLALQRRRSLILNVSRICGCELLEPAAGPLKIPPMQKKKLVLELVNYRNALERAILHFSHYEKETVPLDKKRFRITLWYEPRDERELLIRILSFGPMLKVLEPDSLIHQLQYRIKKQKNLRTP